MPHKCTVLLPEYWEWSLPSTGTENVNRISTHHCVLYDIENVGIYNLPPGSKTNVKWGPKKHFLTKVVFAVTSRKFIRPWSESCIYVLAHWHTTIIGAYYLPAHEPHASFEVIIILLYQYNCLLGHLLAYQAQWWPRLLTTVF